MREVGGAGKWFSEMRSRDMFVLHPYLLHKGYNGVMVDKRLPGASLPVHCLLVHRICTPCALPPCALPVHCSAACALLGCLCTASVSALASSFSVSLTLSHQQCDDSIDLFCSTTNTKAAGFSNNPSLSLLKTSISILMLVL